MKKVTLQKLITLTHKITNVWNGVQDMETMDMGRLVIKMRRADEQKKFTDGVWKSVDVSIIDGKTLEVFEDMNFISVFLHQDVEIITNKINQLLKK